MGGLMRRFFVGLVASIFLATSFGAGAVVRSNGAGNATSMVGAGGVSGPVPLVLAKWSVPIIFGTTASMGNNCAITWTTALPNAYTGGAWVLLPAGAVAAGVPAAAAIYWYVGTDTTHGTCYNSTINLANPGAVGTTTAFSTTGPGAFTGVTAQTTIASITLPANTLSSMGVLDFDANYTITNNANAKSANFIIGGTDFLAAVSLASITDAELHAIIRLGATAAKQYSHPWRFSGAGFSQLSIVYGAEDFGTQLTIAIKGTRGTATDNYILEGARIVVTN